MAVYLATRREVNTQAPQLSHGREAALKKGKRKPEKPSSPPLARFLGHACPGKSQFWGIVPLGHVRHSHLFHTRHTHNNNFLKFEIVLIARSNGSLKASAN